MMTSKLIWWLYALATVIVWFFLAPALISAADTAAVLAGIGLLVLHCYWSWRLWVYSLTVKIKKELK